MVGNNVYGAILCHFPMICLGFRNGFKATRELYNCLALFHKVP